MAVVATLKLDDLVPPCKAPRQSNSAHSGLGTRTGHPHQRHAGYQFADRFGQLDFNFGGTSEAQTALGGFHHGLANTRVVVAHDHWAPGEHVVNVAFAIGIKQIGAICPLHEAGGATYCFKRPHR